MAAYRDIDGAQRGRLHHVAVLGGSVAGVQTAVQGAMRGGRKVSAQRALGIGQPRHGLFGLDMRHRNALQLRHLGPV
ncbi:hypothetical protein D3C71_1243790 [compost metagenome]